MRAGSPSYVPATVCVRPLDGPVGIGGSGRPAAWLSAAHGSAGAPVDQRIAVWFLPPAGSERSLFASAGAIFSRAALFSPGFVGAWTYPVLLFVVLPLAWLLALMLLARNAAGRRAAPARARAAPGGR